MVFNQQYLDLIASFQLKQTRMFDLDKFVKYIQDTKLEVVTWGPEDMSLVRILELPYLHGCPVVRVKTKLKNVIRSFPASAIIGSCVLKDHPWGTGYHHDTSAPKKWCELWTAFDYIEDLPCKIWNMEKKTWETHRCALPNSNENTLFNFMDDTPAQGIQTMLWDLDLNEDVIIGLMEPEFERLFFETLATHGFFTRRLFCSSSRLSVNIVESALKHEHYEVQKTLSEKHKSFIEEVSATIYRHHILTRSSPPSNQFITKKDQKGKEDKYEKYVTYEKDEHPAKRSRCD